MTKVEHLSLTLDMLVSQWEIFSRISDKHKLSGERNISTRHKDKLETWIEQAREHLCKEFYEY